MSRALILSLLVSLVTLPVFAQGTCNLGMTINCTSGGQCTAATTNNGTNMCSGDYITGIVISDQQNRGTVTNFHTTLGLQNCFDNNSFQFGVGIGLCEGIAALGPGQSFTSSGQVNLAGAPASEIVAITIVEDPVRGAQLGLAYAIHGATSAPTPTCTPAASAASSTQ